MKFVVELLNMQRIVKSIDAAVLKYWLSECNTLRYAHVIIEASKISMLLASITVLSGCLLSEKAGHFNECVFYPGYYRHVRYAINTFCAGDHYVYIQVVM